MAAFRTLQADHACPLIGPACSWAVATAPTILGTPLPYPQGPGPHREGGALLCRGPPSKLLPVPVSSSAGLPGIRNAASRLGNLAHPPRILEPQRSRSEHCSLHVIPRSQTPPAGKFLTVPPGAPELAAWGRDRPSPWALKLVSAQQPQHRALGARQGCPDSARAAEPSEEACSRAEAGFLALGTWQMSERPAGLRVGRVSFYPSCPGLRNSCPVYKIDTKACGAKQVSKFKTDAKRAEPR